MGRGTYVGVCGWTILRGDNMNNAFEVLKVVLAAVLCAATVYVFTVFILVL